MKKLKVIITTIILIIIVVSLISSKILKKETTDYSKYNFTNIRWTREIAGDKEYIIFDSNGSFIYYCSCGTPINNSDLCNKYTYNDKKKEIKLKCVFRPPSTITKIKIKNITDNNIEI